MEDTTSILDTVWLDADTSQRTAATSESLDYSSRSSTKVKAQMLVDGIVETCMRPAPFFLGPNTIRFVR